MPSFAVISKATGQEAYRYQYEAPVEFAEQVVERDADDEIVKTVMTYSRGD